MIEPHGVIWRRSKENVYTTHKFDDIHVQNSCSGSKRSWSKHKDYYRLKLMAALDNSIDAWHTFNTWCKLHGYEPVKFEEGRLQ
jgi:hypothetical protein